MNSGKAIEIYPSLPMVNSSLKIKTEIFYDMTKEPVRNAKVFYSLKKGTIEDCKNEEYDLSRTMEEVRGGVYEKEIVSFEEGEHTVCIKAEKEGYKTSYSRIQFRVTNSELEFVFFNFLALFNKFTGFFSNIIF